MEYTRNQFYTLKERILEPRKFMQVLAGPRQVGKSTLVDQVLAHLPAVLQVTPVVSCCTNFHCGEKAKAMRLTLFTNISH